MVAFWSSLIGWFAIHGLGWFCNDAKRVTKFLTRLNDFWARVDSKDSLRIPTIYMGPTRYGSYNEYRRYCIGHKLWAIERWFILAIIYKYLFSNGNVFDRLQVHCFIFWKNIFWLNLLCNHKLIQKCAQIPLGVYSRFSQVQPSLKSILVQHMIWLLKSPYFLLRTFGIFFK